MHMFTYKFSKVINILIALDYDFYHSKQTFFLFCTQSNNTAYSLFSKKIHIIKTRVTKKVKDKQLLSDWSSIILEQN